MVCILTMDIIVNLILISFLFLFLFILILILIFILRLRPIFISISAVVRLCNELFVSLKSCCCWVLLGFCGPMAVLMCFLWGWCVEVGVFSTGCLCPGTAYHIFSFILGLILVIFCILCLRF